MKCPAQANPEPESACVAARELGEAGMGSDYVASTGCSSGVATMLQTEVTDIVQHCMTKYHPTICVKLVNFMLPGFHPSGGKKN